MFSCCGVEFIEVDLEESTVIGKVVWESFSRLRVTVSVSTMEVSTGVTMAAKSRETATVEGGEESKRG